ncbi:unnamed protein product [Vitrella brassicaformis CCMP3155]|uniref:Uncharacterized protein n=1 Tax=Vitrella brassicaformis (strain CCMP3155) TaxID=1169540 RepID=A0A0G4G679_VITBC|nr:unnamed protein product [Vitrella brassicaformis CCMP3155]|eukprot:CEM24026.1 unnamed protein product [Vitrella brassicaformis CCMP3155]
MGEVISFPQTGTWVDGAELASEEWREEVIRLGKMRPPLSGPWRWVADKRDPEIALLHEAATVRALQRRLWPLLSRDNLASRAEYVVFEGFEAVCWGATEELTLDEAFGSVGRTYERPLILYGKEPSTLIGSPLATPTAGATPPDARYCATDQRDAVRKRHDAQHLKVQKGEDTDTAEETKRLLSRKHD